MSDTVITMNQTAPVADAPDPLRRIQVGETLSLSQLDPGVHKLSIGAGWDLVGFDSDAMDIDLSVFLLNASGQTRVDEDFIFYNNESSPDGAVVHKGDNRTGAGEGDDERVSINLKALPFDITTIWLVLSVYDGDMRAQYFKNTRNFFIRIENEDRGVELVRFDLDQLSEQNPDATSLLALALERDISGWAVTAHGKFDRGGLHAIATSVGIEAI